MPLPRLPGLGIEKILFPEEFVGEAVPNFFGFCVEGGYEGLCLLCSAHGSLSLDRDYWGVGCGCFRNSGVFLGAKTGDVSPLVALEAKSALNSLPLFFVCECGPCPCLPYVHGVWVPVVKGVPPLRFCSPSSSVVSSDPFLEEDVFLLVLLRRRCPVVPRDQVVEFDAVGH